MSNLIVPNNAKRRMVGSLSGAYPNTAAKIGLFKNNYTIVAATELTDLTAADFSGYAETNLTTPVIVAGLDGSNRAVATWDAVTWTKSGATGNTVYGYYVVNGSNELMWAETFDAPVALTSDGMFIVILPKLTVASQYGNS